MKNILKRKYFISLLMLIITSLGFSQAKKPTIMIVPSDVWCTNNGYMMEYDNQGTKVKIPDYKRAFQENAELLLVTAKLSELMAEREFPLESMEGALKTLASESAEDALLTSKTGAGISESPIDKLKKTAKADIWMQVTWTINQIGPKKSITFILQGLDAYTNKQVAGASGTGNELIGATLQVMLQTAVLSHLDNFNVQLMAFKEDMFINGREIIIRIKKFESWDGDLEKEYDGKELNTIIEEWLTKNTVQGRFSTVESTENMMLFKQVRIPMYNEAGTAIDARGFCKELQNYLKKPPFAITNKLMMKGLGESSIVLGDK
ncbi:DUF6175 family protein [Flavobacterium frigoris]|uniref:Uncharacterized protein n=1 Tax=Flavobacterium frigoris TaxID=229204 RepID=A0A1H9RP46_FLAFI|nr:DUF6175 family protein [Flavobacterium frigoris]SER74570.1 hypothetical protein SAMN05444355_1234 [Flavobacterium frigoris]